MSVDVRLSGRLGNNLFQYALGRVIAEQQGLEFNCLPPDRAVIMFMGQEVDIGPPATLANQIEHFPNASFHIPGRRVTGPIENLEIENRGDWNGVTVDLSALLADRTPRHFKIHGGFQREEYFTPFRNEIRKWFRLKRAKHLHRLMAEDVVVNIRRGYDFGALNLTLSMSYYHHALATLRNVRNIYVCGTGIDNQVRASLACFSPIYYDGTPIDHFRFIQRFNRIVLSNSTFAWWAAFLSDASEIVGPRSRLHDCLGLSGDGTIDLAMKESRYREIDVSARAKLAFCVPEGVVFVSESGGREQIQNPLGNAVPIPIAFSPFSRFMEHLCNREPIPLTLILEYFSGDQGKARDFLTWAMTSNILSQSPVYLDGNA
ncbi:MAG: hypothetical protein BGO25_03610 [Acidobacteriales bacterium 59-55]|nr:alpha-1,2-fucosyltransferase [Terriglobales bacterium]OJV40245.1 MAG: hypothetical protein BGO25_03610 [Acidobacteriales bacterium 59-55]